MKHGQCACPPIAFSNDNHRIILQWGMIAQKAKDDTDKICRIKKTVEILGIEFSEPGIVIVGIHHLVIGKTRLSGIDVKEISQRGPGDMIGDIMVSPAAVDAIIQRVPAGVHAHEARTRGTPWTAVKEDKQGLVLAPFVRSMKAVPDPCLGRLMGESRKITPIVEIECDGFDIDKPGFIRDGLMLRTVEAICA